MNSTRQTMVSSFLAAAASVSLAATSGSTTVATASDPQLLDELKQVPYRIVYESFHEGNWELFLVNADGSHPVNLTQTPDIDELYPHASPDGAKVSFLVDSTEGGKKVRSVYFMSLVNPAGTRRTLVARNARWPCWKSDGSAIAYLKAEADAFSYEDYATERLVVYDVESGQKKEHVNRQLRHLYCICWSPDGNWFLATVHGGMGFRHTILAIEADGEHVYDLNIRGCRPDISPDGTKVAWGRSDWTMCVADLDLTGKVPTVRNQRDVVTSPKPMMIYHMDWSPDGRYIAFSRGPGVKSLGRHPAIIGIRVQGWDLCVADAAATNRWAALNVPGPCSKEPDWMPLRSKR